MKNPRATAGLGWYSKEQWPEYLRMMEDDELNCTHEEWLKKALDVERQMKKQGVEIVRVPVDLSDFYLWCSVRSKKRDGTARAEYVRDKINGT
jgi:hypothetical protein